ncbi:hypothetical protein NC653_016171 [Populus alba x Populus x berolinensis]|uniref:Uncharacterized protein n=1 Tax=Populus alba x Populus x berolinensis TaxID=444605 RepID=A0AAD6QM80_9ROSI|nr:hypothetical protein NC653_016171 [Populus alba x Populus x berolinensis]
MGALVFNFRTETVSDLILKTLCCGFVLKVIRTLYSRELAKISQESVFCVLHGGQFHERAENRMIPRYSLSSDKPSRFFLFVYRVDLSYPAFLVLRKVLLT